VNKNAAEFGMPRPPRTTVKTENNDFWGLDSLEKKKYV
jgi:hypothetical protein